MRATPWSAATTLAAVSTLLGCTGLLGDYEISPSAQDATTDALSTPDAPSDRTGFPPRDASGDRQQPPRDSAVMDATGETRLDASSDQSSAPTVVLPPTISPDEGTYKGPLTVTLTNQTPGATIWYTINDSAPTPAHSPKYVGPFTLTRNNIVRAISDFGGQVSPELRVVYTLCDETCGGASCVDLATDSAHCGTCGASCGARQTCVGKKCTCPSGEIECPLGGKSCVDTKTDPNNCGFCGTVCRKDQECGTVGVKSACVCAGGQTECSGTCVDMLTDSSHCGACDRRCDSTSTCKGGLCEPELVCDLDVGSVDLLAASMTAYQSSVYWTANVRSSSTGYVLWCDVTTKTGKAIANSEGTVNGISYAQSSSMLYWADSGRGVIRRFGVSDGSFADLVTGSAGTRAVLADSSFLFYTDESKLWRRLSTPTEWFSGALYPAHIAVDAFGVFVAEQGKFDSQGVYQAQSGRVTSCSRSSSCGTGPTVLLSGLDSPTSLAVSDNTVYVLEAGPGTAGTSGTLKRCSTSETSCAGKPTTLAGGLESPRHLILDPTYAYFGAAKGVYRCPRSGCPAGPTPLALGSDFPALAVSGDYLYFAQDHRLFRIPK